MNRIEYTPTYLAISLGNPYYTKERISHYLSWAEVQSPKFGFLIGDQLFQYTLGVFQNLNMSQAHIRACSIGDNMAVMLHKIILAHRGLRPLDIRVIRWKDLASTPEYNKFYRTAIAAYSDNSKFRQAVRDQIVLNLGNRIASHNASPHSRNQNAATEFLDRYILEEIAGLITISECFGYPQELYPGKDLAIMENIYDNKFPEFSEVLPGKRKRQFLSLRIE